MLAAASPVPSRDGAAGGSVKASRLHTEMTPLRRRDAGSSDAPSTGSSPRGGSASDLRTDAAPRRDGRPQGSSSSSSVSVASTTPSAPPTPPSPAACPVDIPAPVVPFGATTSTDSQAPTVPPELPSPVSCPSSLPSDVPALPSPALVAVRAQGQAPRATAATPDRVVRHLTLSSSTSPPGPPVADGRPPPRLNAARTEEWSPESGPTAAAIMSELATAAQAVQALQVDVEAREAAVKAQWERVTCERATLRREAVTAEHRMQRLRAHNSVLQRQCDEYRQRLAAATRDLTASRRDNVGLRAEQSFDAMTLRSSPPGSAASSLNRSASSMLLPPPSPSQPPASPPTTLPMPIPQPRRSHRAGDGDAAALLPLYGSTPTDAPPTVGAGGDALWFTPAKVAPSGSGGDRSDDPYGRVRRLRRHTGDDVEEIAQQAALARQHNDRLHRELSTLRALCERQGEELLRLRLTRRSGSAVVGSGAPGTSGGAASDRAGVTAVPFVGDSGAAGGSLPITPEGLSRAQLFLGAPSPPLGPSSTAPFLGSGSSGAGATAAAVMPPIALSGSDFRLAAARRPRNNQSLFAPTPDASKVAEEFAYRPLDDGDGGGGGGGGGGGDSGDGNRCCVIS